MRNSSKNENQAPSSPLWMSTYGDMVTLLLVFFVLLFSFSTIDAAKWRTLVVALTGNPGVFDSGDTQNDLPPNVPVDPTDSESESTFDQHSEQPSSADTDEFEELYQRIKIYIDERNLKGELELTKTESEILIRFRDNVMFDSGRADLKPLAKKILGDIAEVLLIYQEDINMIRIEGHTDNVPINTSRFPSNWELSTTRATQVLRYFAEQKGLNPTKLSALGFSEYHPVFENDTAENRAINRRVDIVIVRTIVTDL